MNELRKIEAQIGFTSGILVGALAGGVFLVIFAQVQWYFKIFYFIGSAGVVGSLVLSLKELIKMRRNYLEISEMTFQSSQNGSKTIGSVSESDDATSDSGTNSNIERREENG